MAMHAVRSSEVALLMPWDMDLVPLGGAAAIPMGDQVRAQIPCGVGSAHDAGGGVVGPPGTSAGKAAAGTGKVAMRVKSGRQPYVADLADRTRAIARWVAIHQQMAAAGSAKAKAGLELALSETFESRDTATLLSCASSMTLYIC